MLVCLLTAQAAAESDVKAELWDTPERRTDKRSNGRWHTLPEADDEPVPLPIRIG